MPRGSPQTDRVRWIIAMFAAKPRESFSLAQIARHLGVSKATCLPAVAALTHGGWLVRHPERRTYRLGPALIEIGRAAEAASHGAVIGGHLRALSEETGLGCIVWDLSSEHLVLSEIVGPTGPRPAWAGLERGHRLLPLAPLASTSVAWGDEPARRRWLATVSGAAGSGDLSRRLRGALDAVRRQGYAIELQERMYHDVFRLVERLRSARTPDVDELVDALSRRLHERLVAFDYVLVDPDPDQRYEPVSINAPVFDRFGDVVCIVCLVDFPSPLPGDEVARFGKRVRGSAEAMTAALDGVLPSGWPR